MIATETHPLLARIQSGETLVSDGATGTYLQLKGLEPGGSPEEFNVSRPEIVRTMAASYFDAGADMVLTNSFGGNKFMLAKYGLDDRLEELNRLAASLARSVAPPGRFVVGSVGPTGEFLAPLGEVGEEEMAESFARQARALEEGGADAIVIETMTAIEEATLAVRMVREHTRCIAMATMVFDKGPRGYFTMMGITPERAMKELVEAGAHVVGSNCGNGIELMIELAPRLRAATAAPLLIHSNAGIPKLVKTKVVYDETPDWMTPRFLRLRDLGVNIIGGCCGTTPEHIRALARAIRGDDAEQSATAAE